MELIKNSLQTIAKAMIDPSYLAILIVITVIFYIKNRKISYMQKLTIGEQINSPMELTISQIVLGIVAGSLGSIIINLLGVTFKSNSGIEFLFILSLMLLLFKPKFVCFAYSGSILGIVSIVLSFISNKLNNGLVINLNILSLMTFVGVLHMVEGMLVMIDGSRGAIPVFTKREDNIVGGFSLRRYWALPVAILMIVSNSNVDGQQLLSTAAWWPIIKNRDAINVLSKAMIISLPFYGVVGYSSITFTREKERKAIISGIAILVYGISLVIVSQIADIGIIGQVIVLIYAPFAHELMLKYQRNIEKKNCYPYVSDDTGISILEVAPNSVAFQAGIRRGDKVIAINGEDVSNEGDIFKAVHDDINGITIKIKTAAGNVVEHFIKPKNKRLGILLVPRLVKEEEIVNINKDEFKRILEKLNNKK